MLYIRLDYRRSGAGAELVQHIETLYQTPKLFTSTNLANLPMQSLLAKLGYALSGVIHNLDEDDLRNCLFQAASLKKAEWLTIHRTCGQRNLSQPEARFIKGICLMERKSIIRNFSQFMF